MARESLISILDRSKKRILVALGVAILVHLPVTPMLPVMRIVHRIAMQRREVERHNLPEPPREVEVQLEQALNQEAQHQAQKEAAQERREPASEAGALSMPEAANVPFNQAKAVAEAPQPVEDAADGKLKEAKKEKLKDVGLEGDLAKKKNENPGISLGLWLSSLRENPLGKHLVQIASCDREWRGFVEQGIDPLNDFEGVLVVGPSLFDPGAMTAAVRHSLPKERVQQVVDGLVQRSGRNGRWLEPGVATARMGKAQRVLLPHQDDLFFVAPTKGWQALHKMQHPMKVPASEGRLASVVLSRPNQVLRRAGLVLPERIASLRLEVYANSDESSDLKLELEDESERAAAADVSKVSRLLSDFFSDVWLLTSTLSSFTGDRPAGSGPELSPSLTLHVDEKSLAGSIHLSSGQTRTVLDLAASLMCRKPKPKAK